MGIRVEFVRRGSINNNAHEQMHGVMKNELVIAATARAQARGLQRWTKCYNCDRPNEAIGLRTPASCISRAAQTSLHAVSATFSAQLVGAGRPGEWNHHVARLAWKYWSRFWWSAGRPRSRWPPLLPGLLRLTLSRPPSPGSKPQTRSAGVLKSTHHRAGREPSPLPAPSPILQFRNTKFKQSYVSPPETCATNKSTID